MAPEGALRMTRDETVALFLECEGETRGGAGRGQRRRRREYRRARGREGALERLGR